MITVLDRLRLGRLNRARLRGWKMITALARLRLKGGR